MWMGVGDDNETASNCFVSRQAVPGYQEELNLKESWA